MITGSTEERFAALAEAFRGKSGVTLPGSTGSKGFGSATLRVNNKIFAMLASGTLVLKLPQARVDAMVASDAGSPFDGGKGKPMKEWVCVRPGDDQDWAALAREAMEFVASKR